MMHVLFLTLCVALLNSKKATAVADIEHVCRNIAAGGADFKDVLELPNLIDADMAESFILYAEEYAEENGGWGTRRHDLYPTTDININDILQLVYPVHNIVYRDIIPRIVDEFNLDKNLLGIYEVFIARYSAEIESHQRHLELHADGSDFSFVITLNGGFTGGGTIFNQTGAVYNPGPGGAIAFCGKRFHGGAHVTGGTRYILAGFLNYGEPSGCSVIAPATLYNDEL